MKSFLISKINKVVFVSLVITLCLSFNKKNETVNNWPNWRGPENNGVALNANPITEWSETENIKWKTPIPGKGIGTPVIWEDQIFITTAIELDKKATEEAIKRLKKTHPTFVKVLGMSGTTDYILQFVVYSINRHTGAVNWKKVVREQFPHEGMNDQGSWASASCVTDGEHVIAHFGSYGTYCFNMTGSLIWEKDLGDMHIYNAFGEGTSPVIHEDRVIIVWDHEGYSKIYVLDKKSGKEIWQKDRNEGSAWVTPIVVDVEGVSQIIVPGTNKSIGYNFDNGKEIWTLSGLGEGAISCPVFDGEMVYLMTGFSNSKKVQAVNLSNAHGDLDGTEALIWSKDKNTSYVPSPLLYNGKLYYLKVSKAQLSCVNAKTGEIYFEAQKPELSGPAYASPVFANGYIYFVDRNGICTVIKEGAAFDVVAQNQLDDHFDASPAIVGNQLFLRGFNSLYCISE